MAQGVSHEDEESVKANGSMPQCAIGAKNTPSFGSFRVSASTAGLGQTLPTVLQIRMPLCTSVTEDGILNAQENLNTHIKLSQAIKALLQF